MSLFVKPKCLDFLKSIISHKSKKLLNNTHLSLAYAAKFYFQTLSLFVKPNCWHFFKSIVSHKCKTLFNNGHHHHEFFLPIYMYAPNSFSRH